MREVTREMVKEYELKKLGYDFMGYTFNNRNELSFHHLIVPKRDCKKKGLGEGYLKWNGAILNQDTSHPYLHTIERFDRELFLEITKEMVEENLRGEINIENLKRIREMLLWFEAHYDDVYSSSGKEIIKPEFKTKRLVLPGFEEKRR